MKKILLFALTVMVGMTGYAQSAIDADFETGTLPEGWTVRVPGDPYKGGYSVVDYSAESSLKVANVGANDKGGTYCLLSMTGAKNKVKDNSDNWFISPSVAMTDALVFTFRLAANCSYSPTKEEAEKMKMDVVVIDGTDTITLATIAPENYFTWKQYAYDLSAYAGKTIQVAFHDYGTMGSGAVGEMKYIDNIGLSRVPLSDYVIESVTTLHGQAELTAPYTVRVSNYGIAKDNFTVSYQIGNNTPVSEVVASKIAQGESVDYTFQQAPTFAYGDSTSIRAWVSGANDEMTTNDSLPEQAIVMCQAPQALPYGVCNEWDEDEICDDASQPEFNGVTSSSKARWAYDAVKYNAWIFSQTSNSDKYIGAGYLYTTKAYTLPAGQVLLQTIGTATLTDMMYEVYIAKYADKDMADYATLVGASETLRNVVETETVDTTSVVLNIPEAGDYVLAIRPITHLTNAQMTLIGFNLTMEMPTGIDAYGVTNRDAIYNLRGQRVSKAEKGVFIENGKKYLKK